MIMRVMTILCALILIGTGISHLQAEPADIERPSRQHEVYFRNTPNELNVYKLYGRFDGKTALIIGGIQGDEPGGFLSADLYPNLVLEKGNLIIIPRANFQSIIRNSRGVNGDMNRRFDNDSPKDIDDQIVEVIKANMGNSDILLNLHDGWGYYRPTYEDEMHNPRRFGQSIIADASTFTFEDQEIPLEDMANRVIEVMNQKIEIDEHRYHFMNTHTLSDNTVHAEQLTSATCFALTNFGIPAFGIETSKNLPSLELKIRYHNWAINEFLEILDIKPEHPSILYEPPKLIYMLLSVNSGPLQLVDNGQSIHVSAGDVVEITHIESNYSRGLSCDIQGYGNDNDFQQPYRMNRSSKIVARKDNSVIGEIDVMVDEVEYEHMTYIFEVNGKKEAVLHNQNLEVRRGDKVKILNVFIEGSTGEEFRVNLKGYVPPDGPNYGEDRNYTIDTGRLTWKKYSVNGAGLMYPVVVSKGDKEVSTAYISLN